MKCFEIMDILGEFAPAALAENWDNVGLLVGRDNKDVKSIYVSLDATNEHIDAAAQMGADMMITHHPLIFKGVMRVTDDDYVGNRVMKLVRHDISYYAMHTNYDVAVMANDAADILELSHCEVLEPTYKDDICTEGIGRIGMLGRPMSLEECGEYVKARFELPCVKLFGNPAAPIEVAAICPGSGRSAIDLAVAAGADVLITSDISYNDGIDAVEKGLQIIDAGHFGLEKLFIPHVSEFLRKELPNITIFTAGDNDSPCTFI